MKKGVRKKSGHANAEPAKRKAFYNRLRDLTERMVGPGLFELFPESSLRLMYANRYPSLKFVLDNDRVIDEMALSTFRRELLGCLNTHTITTLTGKKIPFVRFLTDVLVLIHHVEFAIPGKFHHASALIRAFGPYFTKGAWYAKWRTKALTLLGAVEISLYDFFKGTVRCRAVDMALIHPGGKNVLRLYRFLQHTQVEDIEGKKRLIVRLSIPHPQRVRYFYWAMLSPSALGFVPFPDDKPKPLYAQQHALRRFEERTLFPQGFVQAYLADRLANQLPKVIFHGGKSLMECYVGRYKVGYFVITPHRDKWIIRTFLFLTNTGTPEGQKLAQLTEWKTPDRTHLMVDTMVGFYAFDISGDTGLRKLFNKAGCGHVLRLADEIVPLLELERDSPEYIYRYLAKVR